MFSSKMTTTCWIGVLACAAGAVLCGGLCHQPRPAELAHAGGVPATTRTKAAATPTPMRVPRFQEMGLTPILCLPARRMYAAVTFVEPGERSSTTMRRAAKTIDEWPVT